MPLYPNVDVVIAYGYWLDEATRAGVAVDNRTPATVTLAPVDHDGTTTATPNLRDPGAHGWLKTRTRTARVDPATGYFAAVLVATNDPDLDAYPGRQVTFTGEKPFVVQVPYNAPTVSATTEMVTALAGAVPGLAAGQQVKAMPLVDAAITSPAPTPTPALAYLTSTQTLGAIVTAIDVHDDDPWAHSGPTPGWRSRRTASANLSGHRLVVPTSTGSLEYADRLILGHRSRPIWMTLGAALSGQPCDLQMAGVVVEPSWSWTPGPLYLDVNGLATQAPPTSGFLNQVGYATSPTSIYLDRQPSITLAPV